jgi:hypothetical protein
MTDIMTLKLLLDWLICAGKVIFRNQLSSRSCQVLQKELIIKDDSCQIGTNWLSVLAFTLSARLLSYLKYFQSFFLLHTLIFCAHTFDAALNVTITPLDIPAPWDCFESDYNLLPH